MKSTLEKISEWGPKQKGFIHQETAFGSGSDSETIETIFEFIADVSQGFQADIAKRAIEAQEKHGRIRLSEKQAWCIEFEMQKLAPQFKSWAIEKYGTLSE